MPTNLHPQRNLILKGLDYLLKLKSDSSSKSHPNELAKKSTIHENWPNEIKCFHSIHFCVLMHALKLLIKIQLDIINFKI